MTKNKINQKMMVFYILWKAYRENPEQYVPVWRFLGEIFIEELKQNVFASYKCPANGVDLFFENPDLIERRNTTGKSGAKYYEYRIKPNPSAEKIKDPIIFEFYKLLRSSNH